MPYKRLLVFCDGTGQDGLICPDGPTESLTSATAESVFYAGAVKVMQVVADAQGPGPYVTNVLRLSRAVKQFSKDGTPQIVFYQSGVGSDAWFDGYIDPDIQLQQMSGWVVASKIRDAYAFIAQNFEPGDEIFLFGASRGAYTARTVAGLIDKIGLLTTENLGIFFNIWSDLFYKRNPTIPVNTRRARIRLVGVWDTVRWVRDTVDALGIIDTDYPRAVEVALHALSIQENREVFFPTLFRDPTSPKQVLKQIWFPGAHSDVAGGYARHELADISLYWMAGEILERDLFDLDKDFLIRSKQPDPDDWGFSQPNNAYMETPIYQRPIFGHQTRLASRAIYGATILHESWKYSPNDLTNPDYMLTPSHLHSRYPELPYAPLNEFEVEVKKHWKTKLPMATPPVPYDNPGALFSGSQPDVMDNEFV